MSKLFSFRKSIIELIKKPVYLTPNEIAGLINRIAETAGKEVVQILNRSIKGRDTKEALVWDLIVYIETYVFLTCLYQRRLLEAYNNEQANSFFKQLVKEATNVLSAKYKSGSAAELFTDSFTLMQEVYACDIPIPIVNTQQWDEENCLATHFVRRIITSTFIFYNKKYEDERKAMTAVAIDVSSLFESLELKVKHISNNIKPG